MTEQMNQRKYIKKLNTDNLISNLQIVNVVETCQCKYLHWRGGWVGMEGWLNDNQNKRDFNMQGQKCSKILFNLKSDDFIFSKVANSAVLLIFLCS